MKCFHKTNVIEVKVMYSHMEDDILDYIYFFFQDTMDMQDAYRMFEWSCGGKKKKKSNYML